MDSSVPNNHLVLVINSIYEIWSQRKEALSPDGATGIINWSDIEWQFGLPANSKRQQINGHGHLTYIYIHTQLAYSWRPLHIEYLIIPVVSAVEMKTSLKEGIRTVMTEQLLCDNARS